MNCVLICTDLLTTENFGMCSKYIISLIRNGCERFGTYTFTSKSALKFSGYAFKEEKLMSCYNNLIELGVIIREATVYKNEEGNTFDTHIDRIDEIKLKSILSA